jgi:hypothetical protein
VKIRLVAVALLAALAGCPPPPDVRPDPRPVVTPHPSVPPAPDDGPPRAALQRFLAALDGRRYADAYGLLSARWRARYTPQRLEQDFGLSGAIGRESAERARVLSPGPFKLERGRAVLVIGEARAAVLVLEEGGWRVDALE